MQNAIFGIVESREIAEQFVDRLGQEGFAEDALSVLFVDLGERADGVGTRAPEGAVTGASVAGIVGTAFGFLVGLGALFIPGAGPFLAAGPIVSALSIGAASAAAGGVTGALLGMGVPEEGAVDLSKKVAAGHVLMSVETKTGDQLARAKALFEAANAEHVSVVGDGHRLE